MHDKLNDAVEMINSSFSCEVHKECSFFSARTIWPKWCQFQYYYFIAQLLPGFIYALSTTILSSFTLFRAIYSHDVKEIPTAIANMVWTWFYIIFSIATIYYADTTTKAVNFDYIFFQILLISSILVAGHGHHCNTLDEQHTRWIIDWEGWHETNKQTNILRKLTTIIICSFLFFQLSFFSQQIKHRASILSCGFFTIDWTLAFSVCFSSFYF
jgi:hypothetical protein